MNLLLQNAQIKRLCAQMPLLTDATHVEALSGGLTNMNYRIETPNGIYVMRISDKKTDLLGINRENERVNTRKAHKAGVGSAVMDCLPDENVLLMAWIEAKTLHIQDVHQEPNLLPRI